MGKKYSWTNSPIVVVPLFGFAIALGLSPVLAWGTTEAPAFYGSMIAALIAAGAVVGNSRLQRLENDRLRAEKVAFLAKRDALHLLGYLEYSKTALSAYLRFCELCTFTLQPDGQNRPDDKSAHFNAKGFRDLNTVGRDIDPLPIFKLATSVPGKIALSVTSAISSFSREAKTSFDLTSLKDETNPPRVVVEGLIGLAKGRMKLLFEAERQLREYIEMG